MFSGVLGASDEDRSGTEEAMCRRLDATKSKDDLAQRLKGERGRALMPSSCSVA